MAGNGPSRLIIGCGYLGLRVARRWLAQGDAVAALTRSAERAAAFRERGIRPVVGDILSPDRLRDLPPATTVLYAVGYDRTTEASKRTVYVDGLRNVLLSLPKSVERFVYVSSTSVYGQSNGEWVDETSACEPRTDGGQICLDAERLLQSALADRLPVQVLRLSGIYGPDRLIARIDALRDSTPLTGNPDGWLNLIHVEDAATAVIDSAARDLSSDDTLLVSDDRPFRRRVYYEALARLIGAPPPLFAPLENDQPDLGKRCDNRRLHQEHSCALAYPTIDEGLPDAVGAARPGMQSEL